LFKRTHEQGISTIDSFSNAEEEGEVEELNVNAKKKG
jgi:hypothetical protein